MTIWTEKLRLKGMAEEDIYFARRDRELIDALHRKTPKVRHHPNKGQRDKATKD
jgi:hypothetical protein